jgi:ABC-2 type transport system permease protein
MKPAAVARAARNAMLVDLEYRFNLAVLVFSVAVSLFMEWGIFFHLYEGRDVIGGLPRAQALGFVVLGTLMRTLYVIWRYITESVDEIRDGSFRRYLLQPLHYPSYFFAQCAGFKISNIVLMVPFVLLMRLLPDMGDFLNLSVMPQFLPALLMGTFINWQIYLLIVYSGFWLEEASFLSMAFNMGMSFFSGLALPYAWLPAGLRSVLDWTPLPLLGDWVLRSGLGMIEASEWQLSFAKALVWMLVLGLAIRVLGRAGMRRYESYGG